MKLTVITHTDGRRKGGLIAAIRSVEDDLQVDIEHLVIEARTYEEWKIKRLHDVLDHEYVAIVDDDDELVPGSLRMCWNIMKTTSVGVVFTDEIVVRPNGSEHLITNPKRYEDVCEGPRVIHHLSVLNTKHVAQEIEGWLAQTDGVGVDWLMKASAAFNGTAIHIPLGGYKWKQNTVPVGSDGSIRMRYTSHLPRLRQILRDFRAQRGVTGLIPRSNPQEKS